MNSLVNGLTIVRADDVAPQPWKNGGGVTRELLRLPLPGGSADEWLLRISLADIEADGPFSPFPGITRWFAVLEGAGVRLRWPGRPVRAMTPAEPPLRFAGADVPGCDLIAGRTRDLNVMVRDDAGEASLGPVGFDEENWLGHASAFGIFTLRAALLHGAAAQPIELPARTLAWCAADKSASRMWWLEEPLANAGSQGQTVDRDTTAPAAPIGYAINLHSPAIPTR